MRPPIVLECTGDLYVAYDVQSAERKMEAVDVESGDWVVYDSQGRLLAAYPIGGTDRVRLADGETSPSHAEELRSKIIGYLTRVSELKIATIEVDDLHSDSLPTLIARLAAAGGSV